MEAHELSLYVYEHILASHYGWALEAIRSLDLQDFYAHLRICMAREAVKNEFQAMLAGAMPSGDEVIDEKITSQPQVVSSKRLPSGAIVETTKEKPVRFSSKVKKVRIDKKGDYIGDA